MYKMGNDLVWEFKEWRGVYAESGIEKINIIYFLVCFAGFDVMVLYNTTPPIAPIHNVL